MVPVGYGVHFWSEGNVESLGLTFDSSDFYCLVAQWLEHLCEKEKDGGSNPSQTTNVLNLLLTGGIIGCLKLGAFHPSCRSFNG